MLCYIFRHASYVYDNYSCRYYTSSPLFSSPLFFDLPYFFLSACFSPAFPPVWFCPPSTNSTASVRRDMTQKLFSPLNSFRHFIIGEVRGNSLQGSLEFPFTRILMKIFRTRSKEIVTECKNYFSLHTVGKLIKKRKLQFLQKIVSSSNTVCNLFTSVAVRESELLAANA